MKKKNVRGYFVYLPAFILSLLIFIILFLKISSAVSIKKNVEDKIRRDGEMKVIIVLKEAEGSRNPDAGETPAKSEIKQRGDRIKATIEDKRSKANKIKED